MEKFTANHLFFRKKSFPSEIHLSDDSLTVKVSGFFEDIPKSFFYEYISSVTVYVPVIGYSTIAFFAGNTRVLAHGFTKSQVSDMKALIEERKANPIAKPTTKHFEKLAPAGVPLFLIERVKTNKKKYNNNEKY